MSPQNMHQQEDGWSRGQIFRTTIIFIEIVVLFAVVILASLPASTVSQTADVASMSEVINMENNVDNDIRVPTTVYVDTSYRVFVIQNNRFDEVTDLAECYNRYINAEFDGVLSNYRAAKIDYLTNSAHAMTFMANDYDVRVNDDNTRVDIAIDNAVYTITLNCNYDYEAYRQNLDDTDDDSPSTLEELAVEADRQRYGCPNGMGH